VAEEFENLARSYRRLAEQADRNAQMDVVYKAISRPDAVDHAPVIYTLDAPHVRQMRLYPSPLLVAQPEQIPAQQSFPQYESTSYCLSGRINEF
jgi:hypothetical protein